VRLFTIIVEDMPEPRFASLRFVAPRLHFTAMIRCVNVTLITLAHHARLLISSLLCISSPRLTAQKCASQFSMKNTNLYQPEVIVGIFYKI